MFLAKAGVYKACGMFNFKHFTLILITLIGIITALKHTVNKKDVKTIIKNCTIFILISEVVIITFKIVTGGISNINNYVPLYYCSLLLYAGVFSSFGKGSIKRVGDVFLATGGIIGGIIFIFFPTTSLLTYPMFHLVSIRSFIYHGIMVYLGLLINLSNYIKLEKKDFIYYFLLLGITCTIAFFVNKIFNSNLMFISQNFIGTPIEIIYNFTGKFFTPFMIIGQSTLPFFIVYGIKNRSVKNLNN